jgi:hypothetical protein
MSTSWETRIAASQAIESIIKNLETKELILFSGKLINKSEKYQLLLMPNNNITFR